jgi:hypothetical protein
MTPAPDMRAGGVPTPGMSDAVSATARVRRRRPRRRPEHAPEDRHRNRPCSVHASILLHGRASPMNVINCLGAGHKNSSLSHLDPHSLEGTQEGNE